jgi:hypothetical protein
MVAPKAGLALGPDVTPVGHDRVVAGNLGILARPATAF